MSQDLYNIAVGIAGALGGWWLNIMWKAIHELESKVASIDVLVAGQYIRKDEFDRVIQALFDKLDKIDDKLDGKADKT